MPQTNLTGTASIPDNSISESKLAFTIDKFPTGTVTMHAGSVAPDGWLLCNGEQLPNGVGTVQGKEADFSALYAVLGTTYGAAGELPDCRGIFIRGVGSQTISGKSYSATRGVKVGDKTVSHNHTITGSVTSNATSNATSTANSVSSTNSFPALRFPGVGNLLSRAAITGITNLPVGSSVSTQQFLGNGTMSSIPIVETRLPTVSTTVNTSVSNTHNLSASNQPGGSTETAPASIGLNYIIKI